MKKIGLADTAMTTSYASNSLWNKTCLLCLLCSYPSLRHNPFDGNQMALGAWEKAFKVNDGSLRVGQGEANLVYRTSTSGRKMAQWWWKGFVRDFFKVKTFTSNNAPFIWFQHEPRR